MSATTRATCSSSSNQLSAISSKSASRRLYGAKRSPPAASAWRPEVPQAWRRGRCASPELRLPVGMANGLRDLKQSRWWQSSGGKPNLDVVAQDAIKIFARYRPHRSPSRPVRASIGLLVWTLAAPTRHRGRRSMAAMIRSLSSCLDATRMWRRTERASFEKKPSTRLSQEPCLGVKVIQSGARVDRRARLWSLWRCARNDCRGST